MGGKAMDRARRVEVTSRDELRAWLRDHHRQDEGIWLVTHKKHCGPRHVPYDHVVEEALCFGWVDSLPRKLDDDRTMVFLSPRRPGSPWSRLNKERVARLEAARRMTAAGRAKIERAKADGTWTVLDEIEDLVVPDDLASALDAERDARDGWEAFPPSVKKGLLWWLKSAKRAHTRKKRLTACVEGARSGTNPLAPKPR